MNLHIVPDNIFINKFCENLEELGISGLNRIVIRTNNRTLKYIRNPYPFAPLYSRAFDELTGDTASYRKVFIHQFTPLLYRWVARRQFNELGWMVWGSDLYNLPSVRTELYEPLTLRQYIKGKFSLNNFLYRLKVSVQHGKFRDSAYSKVDDVLTWMKSEYDFAVNHLHGLNARHQFFFYENDLPYHALDEIMEHPAPRNDQPLYILGNSSTAELNHLDAVDWMNGAGIKADLCVPVSYGDARYARFLKTQLSSYKGGKLTLIDQYMNFQEYLQFLYKADGLIMNNIRPQGYGNIFMMMYLGKKIFLNEKNLSAAELSKSGLAWCPVSGMNAEGEPDWKRNRAAVSKLLSHSSLLEIYRELFS